MKRTWIWLRICNFFTYKKSDTAPAPACSYKVYAVDSDRNPSGGTQFIGVILPANPENVTAGVHSGYVDLSWNGVSPIQYVKHDAIHASERDFSSVAGMTPTITAANAAKMAGLTNIAAAFKVNLNYDMVIAFVSKSWMVDVGVEPACKK